MVAVVSSACAYLICIETSSPKQWGFSSISNTANTFATSQPCYTRTNGKVLQHARITLSFIGMARRDATYSDISIVLVTWPYILSITFSICLDRNKKLLISITFYPKSHNEHIEYLHGNKGLLQK